ncbi:hypothetical protein HME7025_00070 [Aquirufa nivalisilvae]|uniref:Uncharacterized protein n=1 Tax=Aquirufa nivalisilvae TaxID=2516557 RepID=A0A2S2DRF2_9BACT|nr:hypothetical protein HME7025_00070 [Aquirufa nivalisilvae]
MRAVDELKLLECGFQIVRFRIDRSKAGIKKYVIDLRTKRQEWLLLSSFKRKNEAQDSYFKLLNSPKIIAHDLN